MNEEDEIYQCKRIILSWRFLETSDAETETGISESQEAVDDFILTNRKV